MPEGRKRRRGSLHRNGGSYKAGVLAWKICSDFPRRIHRRTLLLRMETTTILNWPSPPLASRSLHDQVEAVAVLVTIKYTAVQRRPPTQCPRTRHSSSFRAGTKIATRYFPCLSRYRRPTADNHRTDPQPLAHRQALYRSKADSRPIHEANLRQPGSGDTRKRAQPGDRPTRTSSPPPLILMSQIPLCCPIQEGLLSAKRPRGHATLRSLRR